MQTHPVQRSESVAPVLLSISHRSSFPARAEGSRAIGCQISCREGILRCKWLSWRHWMPEKAAQPAAETAWRCGEAVRATDDVLFACRLPAAKLWLLCIRPPLFASAYSPTAASVLSSWLRALQEGLILPTRASDWRQCCCGKRAWRNPRLAWGCHESSSGRHATKVLKWLVTPVDTLMRPLVVSKHSIGTSKLLARLRDCCTDGFWSSRAGAGSSVATVAAALASSIRPLTDIVGSSFACLRQINSQALMSTAQEIALHTASNKRKIGRNHEQYFTSMSLS